MMIRTSLRQFLTVVLAVGASLSAGAGEPASASGRSYTFRVDTPPIRVQTDAQGFNEVTAEGFDSRKGTLGVPELPLKTVLVALPAGAEPRLEIRLPGSFSRRAVEPRPRAKRHSRPPTSPLDHVTTTIEAALRKPVVEGSVDFRRESKIYEAPRLYPERVAWLGEIGMLRHQRYVEVHVAPIRYDGATRGLAIDSAVEVTVHFDGARAAVGAPRTEPRFESIYREAFVNYSQGRRFRTTVAEAGPGPVVARAEAPAPASIGPLRRIRIRDNGIIRLDHDFLLAQAPEFLAEPVSTWRLTSQGAQVALQIHQISGGGFDDALLDRPGEYVQFYGQAHDLEPLNVYNSDDGGLGETLYEVRDFTDENVYFLGVEAEAQPSMTEIDATPGAQPPAGPFFRDTLHKEIDEFFWPYADQDLWFWKPFVTESQPLRTDSVALPGLYSGTEPVTFRVNVRGGAECRNVSPDNKTGVFVTNGGGQQLLLPPENPDNVANENIGIFDGFETHLHDFGWVHSGSDPEITSTLDLHLRVHDVPGTCNDPSGPIRDQAILDWIEIDYARRFEGHGGTLSFTWEDGSPVLFEVDGFNSPNIEVYEITTLHPGSYVYDAVRLTGIEVVPDGMASTARFRVDNDPDLDDGTPRRFVVTAENAVATPAPAEIETDRISDLRTNTDPADMVVIVHPDVIPSFCSVGGGPCGTDNDCAGGAGDLCQLDAASEFAQLLTLRATQGITTRIARTPDVEDEFNHGLTGPLALKNFIAWLLAGGWQGDPPTYVMLVGDASYDYKAGTVNGNFVSTQLMLKNDDVLGYYASDNLLAAVSGDDFLPDAVIGRLSTRNPDETRTAAQKLLNYDLAPPPGSWRSNNLLMSDRANDYGAGEALQFESMNADGLDWIEGTAYTNQNLRYWTDYCEGGPGCSEEDEDAMRLAIKQAINGDLDETADGAAIAQFAGHGSFDLWSSDVLFCSNENNQYCEQDDTLELTNGGKLPWLIVHNCLSGGFHSTAAKSLGEQWIKYSGGGSVAVFAPSGLGHQYIGRKIVDETWGALYGPTKERDLAVPVMNSLVRICVEEPAPEACQYYVLLGDPSMRLTLPHVEPPSDLQAVGGNAEVSLSWNASATGGVTYQIYRARFLNGLLQGDYGWVHATASTSWVDGGVNNAVGYVYYVVAQNGDGFDSARSDLNADCEDDPMAPGADCVLATPLNLTPPVQPTGGAAEDTENGGTLIVSWNGNPEDDIGHYTVHFGMTEEVDQSLVVDPTYGTNTTFPGLENGSTYYFAVSATNTSGVTSERSDLFHGVPSLVLGIRAPGLVGDLILDRSADDALLSWSAVTSDIYGGAVNIGEYEVFRGTLATFLPAPGNRIGATPDADYTDADGASGAAPDYFYLVRAVDTLGFAGGVGRQLPGGIFDLRIADAATAGRVELSWSPVLLDFDGAATEISHYELYASDHPFARGAIGQPAVDLIDAAIGGTSIELLPQAQDRYYSVLAVDVKGNRSPF